MSSSSAYVTALLAALGSAAITACAPQQSADPAAPRVPQISESQLREKARESLAHGVEQYNAGKFAEGKFDTAAKLFAGALKQGLGAKGDQITALKHSAFSLCLLNRKTACHNDFAKIFRVEPAFDLAPAEAGHPSWAKVFADAKQRAQAELRRPRRR